MHWGAIWNWLTANNLWKDALSWAVFAVLTWAATWLPWRKHRKTQAKIADSLDTSTPGGLSDLIAAVNQNKDGHEADR
jgi:hypothetical protein